MISSFVRNETAVAFVTRFNFHFCKMNDYSEVACVSFYSFSSVTILVPLHKYINLVHVITIASARKIELEQIIEE